MYIPLLLGRVSMLSSLAESTDSGGGEAWFAGHDERVRRFGGTVR
jgi:hypothetical protein